MRLFTYDIAGREVAYGVLGGQRDGAEHDEDQDEVGEDLVVDQFMAENAKATAQRKRCEETGRKSERGINFITPININVQHGGDSRVRAAEDEEGAALGDGRDLLLDVEVSQPHGAGPSWDLWVVIFIVLFI